MKINHDIIQKRSVLKRMKQWRNERNIIKYFLNRFEWHSYPRLSVVRAYPIHIDIEPTSYCQLQCPMCFRQHRKVEKQGHMSFDLFKKIIDEIEGKVYSIKFTGRGEPLLNKELPRFIEYVKGKKFGEVALITNGQLLTESLMHTFIDSGLDRIAFSIDGLKKQYESIRYPMRYEEIYAIVKTLYNLRKSREASKPIIRIQSVHTSIEDENEFLKRWNPIVDDILFLFYKDYALRTYNDKQARYACPLLYQRMMIHWDGTIPMCVNDEYEETILGDVNTKSIQAVWKGSCYHQARLVHRKGLRDKVYANCSKCALHREGHGKSFWGEEKIIRDTLCNEALC
ncbi:MAG: radical SAM protein [Candidatus Omnitrophica bacterium]|nr:radical SAM protein [Candidatus Omnitrophota bacterium]